MGNGNPVSGHTNHNLTVATATNVDGLGDGDHILSPTLTNMVEGIHGNGVIMYDDTSGGEGDRNIPANIPGAVNYASGTTFTVKGGYAVLDGIMYQFAGGVGATTTYTLNTSSASAAGSPTALTSGKEALVVVYVSADNTSTVKNIYWELGTATTAGTNSYPATPTAFLNTPTATGSSALANTQTVVLAVLRVAFASGGDDLKLVITEVNDKRVFVRPSPMYFSPVTSGDVASTDELLDLDAFHSGIGNGAFGTSRFGAMWQSFGAAVTGATVPDDNKDTLYYSGTHAARYTRSVFDRVLTSTAENITLKSTDANILLLTPSGNASVTTSGSFPAGYIIEVRNLHATRTVTFVRSSSYTVNGGTLTRFICTTSHADTPVFSVLSDDSIETIQLANDSVTTAKIVDANVTTAKIADDAITSAKIADGAVIAAAIGADAVTAAKIGDDVINSEHIAAGAVDLEHMSANSIDSDQYVDASIDTAHIGNNQITNALMADAAIDTAELAASAVETAKINNAAVTADKLASNAVTTVKINADAVTNAKIADDAVDTENIADDAITAALIDDGAVGTAAIGDEQVTLAKLAHAAANTVLVRDANSAGDPSFKAVTNTQILIGNGTGFTAAALSGDVTMSNAGVVAIGNDKITADMIGDNVINSEHYAAASIDNEHLADDAVNSDEIADGAIDTAHIGNSQVTLAKVANIADDRVLGNISGSAAAPAELTAANLRTLLTVADGSLTTNDFTNADHSKLNGIAASANNYVHPNHSGDVTSSADGATTIADNAVTLAKMAGIARGKIIVGDASGNPSVLAAGGNGKLLVADANGDLSWTTVSGDVTLSAGAVTIGNDKIDSQHYAAGSIDNEHLADDAVGADELAANAVVNASVAAGAAITFAKLENLDSAKMLVGSGSNVATEVAISGDVTIANDGEVTIGADKVTYAKIQNVTATNRILGRDSASAGIIEEITPANLRTMINVADGSTAYADSDAISAVEGEATLALAGSVTVAAGKTFVSRRLPVVALTASTTLSEATHAGNYVFVTGSSIVITIPDNQGAGVHFTIINNDGNGFTLRTGTNSSSGDNMNGAQTDIAVSARNGVTCISTGTDYVVLGA